MLANNPLKALIGTRFHPTRLPQNATFPAATYTLISTPRQEFGNQFMRIQFDCYAENYGQVKQILTALENAAKTATSISNLHTVYIDNRFDDFGQTSQSVTYATPLFRGVVDVIFYYLKETIFEQ